ncbi:MAG: DUF962 domain-containing protein [Kofleriaceae bacterium]
MKSLVDQLSNYANYHRDRRNIATHFVGIPMIVLGIQALLARAAFDVAGHALSAAVVVSALAGVFYLVLDLRLGLAMAAFLAGTWWVGAELAAQPTTTWLAAAGALFVGGWIIQFIGHAFEGKKPAFVDDLVGLLVGPLFVVAEAGFAIGLRDDVRAEIERRSGPTRGRAMSPVNAPR